MQVSPISSNAAPTPAPAPNLRLFQPKSPAFALGLATDHLMSKPAFARLPFGEWARVLAGQINRGHFWFAMDQDNKVVGFAGWALTEKTKAEGWIAGRQVLGSRESREGDCVVFNAWAADTGEVHRFMIDQFRRIFAGKTAVYFRRHYAGGRTRSVRLSIPRVSRHSINLPAQI